MEKIHLTVLISLSILLFPSLSVNAQVSSINILEEERFNLKINLLPAVPWQYRKPALEIGFERRINRRWSSHISFFTGQTFYSKSESAFKTSSGSSVYEAGSISYLKGTGITGELRYYLSQRHEYTKGFYCGGYVRGLSVRKVREDLINDQIQQGAYGIILGVGADLGYKFKFGRWTLEPLVGLAAGWNTVWDSLPGEDPNLGDPIYQAVWIGANEAINNIERSLRHVPLWRGEISFGYSF